MDESPQRILFIETKQQNAVKNKLFTLIKLKDLAELSQVMDTYQVDAHEEISKKGSYWTTLHYANHFGSDKILEYLIKKTYQSHKDNFINIVNSQTKEGWSPLMICIIYKSVECLNVMIKSGGLITDLIDGEGFDIIGLCQKHGAVECYERLLGLPKGLLPINHTFLGQKKQSDYENDPKYEELLLNGIPNPCIYCQSNLGYLRYSTCCGSPMHKACLKERNFSCWCCYGTNTEVTGEIIDPEKAFTMPVQVNDFVDQIFDFEKNIEYDNQ